jgi:hypothetical protein
LQDFKKEGGESASTLYQNPHNLLDHANKGANTNYQAAEAVKVDLNEAKQLLAETTQHWQQAQQTP